MLINLSPRPLPACQEKRQLKPAALEELNRIIRFPVIKNDNEPASMILLTGLKCLCVLPAAQSGGTRLIGRPPAPFGRPSASRSSCR